MAQNPQQRTRDYGLSRDVVADFETEEGPATGAQHGETRTRVPEHVESEGHGPKTARKIRDEINRKDRGGTH
jgi:hypothetical protein